MNSNIAIIGSGWLGLPLAESLIEAGYRIHGSTTSKEKIKTLEDSGIIPFIISLSENGIEGNVLDFLKDIDIVIVNVPPKLRKSNSENYSEKMRWLHKAVREAFVQKVVFVSSTSVYGEVDGEVTEETKPRPNTESARQLLASENTFREDNGLRTTVIRFGGLIGQERHPINMLSGKKGLSGGNHPINLIHLDDCIRIIQSIIEKNWWNEIFNGVHPYHPKKKDYYILEAKKRGLQVPDYKEDNLEKSKIIDSNRLISVKNYTFTTTL